MAAHGRRRAWHLVVIPATFLLLSSLRLYSYLRQPSDIWWTPAQLAVRLPDSSDRVEIYLRGALLQTLVGAGRLKIMGDSAPVAAAEVRLRFNNWDRVRAERIASLVLWSALAGAMTMLLAVWLISPSFGRIPQERVAA